MRTNSNTGEKPFTRPRLPAAIREIHSTHAATGFTRLPLKVAIVLAAALGSVAQPLPVAADNLPSYLAPQKEEATGTRLSARDVVQRVFRAPPNTRPDLEAADLTNLDLAELDFKAALLTGADLYGTDLTNARLAGASLVGAKLDRTTITATDFSNADLTDAHIIRPAVFTSLHVASKEAPNFSGAKLVRFRSDGQLDRADFSGADLTGATIGRFAVREPSVNARASLIHTDFTRAILKDARLAQTSLLYARFNDADLRGADLSRCDLLRADFSGADLTGANLTGANLAEADLRTARGLDKVIGLEQALNLDTARRAAQP